MMILERADGTRRVGWTSLVGLLLVPLVLAGGFLATTWRSTDRLDRVQAAVVNLDEPVTIGSGKDAQTVPLGRQLAGGLVNGDGTDQNFSWLLTDATDAQDGLDSGRYAAVVTIPADFSARATSYTDQSGATALPAVLDVATSQVDGVSDPVVGQAITAAAARALNTQLTKAYVSNVYVGFNTTRKQFTKVADAAGELSDGTKRLADGLGQSSDGAAKLSDGVDQLDDGGAQLASGAKKYSRGVGQFADGVDTLADKTAGLPKGARKLADGVAGIADGLRSYQSELRKRAAATASGSAEPLPAGALPTCEQIDPTLSDSQCQRVLGTLGVVGGQAAAQGAARALAGAADGLSTKDKDSGESLISATDKLAGGTDQLADGLKPLAAGIQKLDRGAARLASGAEGLSSGVADYTGGVHGVATGTEQLSDGLAKLSAGGDKLADGTEKLADGLATGAKAIPSYDETARERLSQVVATPVATPTVSSIFSNVATTTLLAVLALWVGGLAAFLVLRAVSARALSSMRPSWRLTLQSALPAAVVAVVQSVVLTTLLTVLLDLDAGQTVRLLGLSALAGLTFVALNQALVAWFGGVGRFVSVVLVVLTTASALTSAVPAVFDSVVPLLPLTPALQGMRAVVTGADGAGGDAGLLLAWLVVGLAAAVLATARRRMIRTRPLGVAVAS